MSLGLLGAGGGILTVPLLVHVAGADPHVAVPLSLAIVGAASLFGAAVSAARGNFAARAAFLIGGGGMLGARLGATLSPRVPDDLLLVIFALVMVVSGIYMWKRSDTRRDASVAPTFDRPPAGTAVRLLPVGFGVGLLTGALGVGGGFLLVPALTLAAGLDMKRATGTSLAVIAMNSAAGLWGHARGERIHFGEAAPYLGMAILGMAAGLQLARHLPARRLQQVFALLVLVMAAVIGTVHLTRLLSGIPATGTR